MKTNTNTILPLAIAAVLLAGIVSVPSTFTFAQNETAEVETTSVPEEVQTSGVEISANDIQRGQKQTLHIQADTPGKVVGIVTYASGHQVIFQGNTDESGALDYPFRVSGNAKAGTFTAQVLTGLASNSTTFEVTAKAAAPVVEPTPIPEPEPEPVPSENVTEPEPEPFPFPVENETAEPEPTPVDENTTTAPEEPVVVAPENETVVVTPENDTGIIPPVNETSVVIPSNETTVPEPTQNETEVIIAPENETEIVTPENATEVPEIPDEAIPQINDTSVIVPGNETEVGENTTVTEPTPEDVTPVTNDTTAGNVTEVVVVPPEEGQIVCIQAPCDPPIGPPVDNGTVAEPEVPAPIPEGNVTAEPEPTPEEAVTEVEEATEELDQAVESGNVDEIIAAIADAIAAQQAIVSVVDTATDEERDNAEEAVKNLNNVIEEAFSEVSENGE